MPQELRHQVEGTVQTTDATVTTVTSYTMPDNCVGFFRVRMIGRRASNGDSAGYDSGATFKRHAAGGATLIAAVTTYAAMENDAAWGITVDASVNDVRVRATGVAAVTIEWLATMDIVLYQP